MSDTSINWKPLETSGADRGSSKLLNILIFTSNIPPIIVQKWSGRRWFRGYLSWAFISIGLLFKGRKTTAAARHASGLERGRYQNGSRFAPAAAFKPPLCPSAGSPDCATPDARVRRKSSLQVRLTDPGRQQVVRLLLRAAEACPATFLRRSFPLRRRLSRAVLHGCRGIILLRVRGGILAFRDPGVNPAVTFGSRMLLRACSVLAVGLAAPAQPL